MTWASGFLAVAGLVGTWQLMSGAATPPVSDLAPLGLSSWTWPGLWLFGSVVVPWFVAVIACVGRRRATPLIVLVACGLLVLELVVQVPFIGLSPLSSSSVRPLVVWCGVPWMLDAEAGDRCVRLVQAGEPSWPRSPGRDDGDGHHDLVENTVDGRAEHP